MVMMAAVEGGGIRIAGLHDSRCRRFQGFRSSSDTGRPDRRAASGRAACCAPGSCARHPRRWCARGARARSSMPKLSVRSSVASGALDDPFLGDDGVQMHIMRGGIDVRYLLKRVGEADEPRSAPVHGADARRRRRDRSSRRPSQGACPGHRNPPAARTPGPASARRWRATAAAQDPEMIALHRGRRLRRTHLAAVAQVGRSAAGRRASHGAAPVQERSGIKLEGQRA